MNLGKIQLIALTVITVVLLVILVAVYAIVQPDFHIVLDNLRKTIATVLVYAGGIILMLVVYGITFAIFPLMSGLITSVVFRYILVKNENSALEKVATLAFGGLLVALYPLIVLNLSEIPLFYSVLSQWNIVGIVHEYVLLLIIGALLTLVGYVLTTDTPRKQKRSDN